VGLADIGVHCGGVSETICDLGCDGLGIAYSLGVEYKAAMPARKSLAKSLPPVADAA
jgi:hypothetical protein